MSSEKPFRTYEDISKSFPDQFGHKLDKSLVWEVVGAELLERKRKFISRYIQGFTPEELGEFLDLVLGRRPEELPDLLEARLEKSSAAIGAAMGFPLPPFLQEEGELKKQIDEVMRKADSDPAPLQSPPNLVIGELERRRATKPKGA